jgi:hypothetical protein
MSVIDSFLPRFQFREIHRRRMAVPAARACAAVRRIDLADSPVVVPLFALRSLPARLSGRGGGLGAGRFAAMLEGGFVTLHESATALVFGSAGRFWTTGGGIRRVTRESFVAFGEAGCARLAWSFEFLPERGANACEAVTETRIDCCDSAALRSMRLYWLLIRPASGLIRREILRLVERAALAAPSAAGATP